MEFKNDIVNITLSGGATDFTTVATFNSRYLSSLSVYSNGESEFVFGSGRGAYPLQTGQSVIFTGSDFYRDGVSESGSLIAVKMRARGNSDVTVTVSKNYWMEG